MTTQPSTPDLVAIKGRQQLTWSSGDFDRLAALLTIVGELLCEAVDFHPGQRVLDVACGSGNTALAAARRFGDVTGADYVPALVERARERAACERLPITFEVGDAEQLPYPDASFDVVLSTYGVMFAPNQEQAARELLRVCRPGGRIGLANWTPEGWLGGLFRVTGRHVPPPPGLASPMRWGTEDGLRELFGDGISSLTVERRDFVFRYPSPRHWLDFWRDYYGPTLKAFEAVGEAGREALERDLLEHVAAGNRSGDETMIVPGEYLEVVAVRS